MSNNGRYKIPILDQQAQYQKLRGEIHQALDEVLETQQFILGPAVEKFEGQSADYLRTRFAIGVASGSDALLLALMALEIGPGDDSHVDVKLAVGADQGATIWSRVTARSAAELQLTVGRAVRTVR